MHVKHPMSSFRNQGFTLVEIMIVVAIVGLLAAMAIPGFQRARRQTQNTRFVNDLKVAVDAFEMYATMNPSYPPDNVPGIIPPEMNGWLDKMDWSEPTPLGGFWDWDYQQFGFTAGVSVWRPDVNDARMQEIDAMIDDGSLSTGMFRKRNDGYIYIIEL